MTKKKIAESLIKFLAQSPTPYHVVENAVAALSEAGFKELKEKDRWKPAKNGKYYVVRADTSIIAFKMGSGRQAEKGFRMVGAHTDSPSLKIKAQPENRFKNYLSLGVEVYGGAILGTWFDRDLSIAGRVVFVGKDQELQSTLVDFKRPVAIIPNLAIHLNQNVNEKTKINRQKELPPVFLQIKDTKKNQLSRFRSILKKEIKKTKTRLVIEDILDYDLNLYDTHSPSILGYEGEFLAGGRIDNQLSCFAGLQALLVSDDQASSMIVLNDHEEVGSHSRTGAAGPFLETVLERIMPERENYLRMVSQSTLISVDNAHGVHPNYVAQYDDNHGPLLNQGPAIKINANQRYATNSDSSSLFRLICKRHDIPVQTYINHSNLACGSTIGPITSTRMGLNTLDIGVPTFAMHSIRETCGTDDVYYLYKALRHFFDFAV